MSEQGAGTRVGASITIAHLTCFDERLNVCANEGPPKSLSDSAYRRLVAVMRRIVQRPEHFFTQTRKHDYSCLESALVDLLQQTRFDDKLVPDVHVALEERVDVKVMTNGFRTEFDKLSHSRDRGVGTLLSKLIDAYCEAVNIADWADERRDTACETGW